MPLLRQVTIEGFKSIRNLELELGRVNVLIGANGAGKSNVLEAIAYGVAWAHGKLDNEYLVPRGVRVTEARFMTGAFDSAQPRMGVTFRMQGREPLELELAPNGHAGHASLLGKAESAKGDRARQALLERGLRNALAHANGKGNDAAVSDLLDQLMALTLRRNECSPDEFQVYAPENSALRIFQAEPQILPLGGRGEGLFAHLKWLGEQHPDRLESIVESLSLLDWFENLQIPKDLAVGERSLRIRDRYLAPGALFDQRSANEGFLFLLFYLTLFVSDETPSFFAIDNVDTALNPKLATATVRKLAELAHEHDKQVIFTTHSPAVLDALDLGDDEQRLLVADRDDEGGTRVRRVPAPKPLGKDQPVPLSEAFVRGYLGGLPEHFKGDWDADLRCDQAKGRPTSPS